MRLVQRPLHSVAKVTALAGLGLGMVCGLLLLLGGIAAPVTAAPLALSVSGNITNNTVWGPGDSPIIITGTVTVISGTLTISPGVEVKFGSNTELIIQTNGKLVANGTLTQPITFTSNISPTASCAWNTIRLFSDGNTIRHSLIEYARWGIYIEPFSGGHNISSNTFRQNGLCLPSPVGAGIAGSPDNSTIADNTFVNNNSAIYVTKASGNIVLNNTISGTGQAAIAFVRSGSTSTRSSNNQVHSNTVRYAGDFGIYMAVGSDNSILNNKVFSSASGIRLEDQNATIGKRLTVRNNDVYSHTNGFGLYITDTAGLDLGENLILDNRQGVLWDLNNDPGSTVITRNVICRNPIYLFRNNDATSVTAAPNWWGKNNPAIGTEIQGPVVITPNMVLSATAIPNTLPANGVSTTTLTVSLQGGGETVPLRARTIALTTTTGAISPTVVTLNNSGIATATYTSANMPGVAVITATDICAFQVTSTVTLTAVYNLAITKTTALTWAVPGQVVTYTIQYSNTNNYTATGVVISDALPAFSTYVGDTSALTRTGSGAGPITWTVGTLLPHTGNSFVLTTSITSTATCNSFITNTVFISGAGGEPALGDNSSSASRQILCGVNLVVVKNDGVGLNDPRLNAAAGEYITYTISVNNMGNQLASNVILSDTLPANTIFNAARSTSGWTLTGSGVYTINLGNLAGNGGGTVVYFVAQVDPNLSCAITQTVNTATASSNGPEIYPPDNTSNEQTPVVCGPSLQLSKEDFVPCAIPGQLIDYAITVNNTGTAAVNNLILTEFLPTNTSFQGPASAWTTAGGNTYTHNIGTLNGSQINTTGFSVQVATSTTASAITNVVTLQPTGLSFTLTTPISTSAPDLYVIKNDNIELLSTAAAATIARLEQKLGPLPWLEAVKGEGLGSQAIAAKPGDVISYTLAFGNAGTSPAANIVISETLPANTTFLGPAYWTAVNANTYVYTISTLLPGNGGNLDFRVRVANPFPIGTPGVTNTVQIAGTGLSECDTSNNISREFTRIDGTTVGSMTVYLPLIFKTSQTSPTTPTPTPTPIPLAYVSDVKADPDTNQVFVASPRHDWVYVINGSNDTLARNVPVGHGPTGLTVLDGATPANNKVFVAHQYGANQWHPGFMAFGVNDTSAHVTADGGYAGAAPIKTAANAVNNNRVYVSNYFDKLAVFNGNSGPPEARVGWVVQKAFQGAYGIDTSSATNRVYLATRDTGELVVFDGNGDRLLQSNYIPTHVKPPQACSLWTVAVNETTGHVFVPCPQLSKVFVLQESQVSVLDLEALGTLEERDGFLALVVSPQAAPWLADISIPSGANLGEEGIAVDTSTSRVFITNGQNNSLVILQDGATPTYVTTVAVGTKPQGVDVNPATQKVYVGNTGSNSVTVLNATSPFSVTKTIPLTP